MSQVTIFTKPGCPHCAAAKQDLARRGVAYVEHNARDDAGALQRMLELNCGRRLVPTLVEGDRVTVGFDGC
jgi:glutaredoxin 3